MSTIIDKIKQHKSAIQKTAMVLGVAAAPVFGAGCNTSVVAGASVDGLDVDGFVKVSSRPFPSCKKHVVVEKQAVEVEVAPVPKKTIYVSFDGAHTKGQAETVKDIVKKEMYPATYYIVKEKGCR